MDYSYGDRDLISYLNPFKALFIYYVKQNMFLTSANPRLFF